MKSPTWNTIIWAQFDAAIATLENAITACPAGSWEQPCGQGVYWRWAFHALFWLDVYLDESLATFVVPAPFTTFELDEHGQPPRVYTQAELLEYVRHGRAKCRARMAALSDEDLARLSGFPWLARRGMSVAESMLYNLRHVQHHAAQLNLVLRTANGIGAAWVHRGAVSA